MKTFLTTRLLAALTLTCSAPGLRAEDKQDKPSREYAFDFSGQDLSGRDFSKQHFDNADFTDAILKNTKFEGASLKDCNFQGALLEGTIFSYADLTGSDFRSATFRYPSLYQSVLNRTNFSGVDLNGTSLSEKKMREAIFHGTKGFGEIYGSDFYMADFRGADLSKAYDMATNKQANLRKAKYDQLTRWYNGFDPGPRGLTYLEAKNKGTDDEKKTRPDIKAGADDDAESRVYAFDYSGQDLSNRDFSKLRLDNADFTDANLKNAKFEGASLKDCNFQGALLDGTNFSYADLTGSDFRSATFRFPSLYQSVLNRTNFSGVDLNGVSLSGKKIQEAIFEGAKGFGEIYGSDFTMADFRGADLSKAYDMASNERANLQKAKYDQFTLWHEGFDPEQRGLTYVDTKKQRSDTGTGSTPDMKTSGSKPSGTHNRDEAAFQKLDKNDDGVLSGSEANGLGDLDANKDGDITPAEFLKL